MKKIIISMLLIFTLASCGGEGEFSANYFNPFSNEDQKSENSIMLANGMQINMKQDIDALLASESIHNGEYVLEAKVMVKDSKTNAIQFVDFPRIERISKKNTDIFDLPEELVYEDPKTGLKWEKDGTRSGLLTYTEAANYCKKFGESSYGKPFSVPNPQQLLKILKPTKERIDTTIFKNRNATYWTTHKFAYSFYYGDGENVDKNRGLAYVRCVGN